MHRLAIRPYLEIAGQPSHEDLVAIRDEGFTAVVNLRRPDEPDQPIDPSTEGSQVHALGMDYLSVPIGGEPLGESQVKAVCAFLDQHTGGKVLLHCKQGGRAAAIALIHLAQAEQWPEDEVIDRAAAIGVPLPPPLRAMIESYFAR
ncbi:beta-lactamase hydrolase domain-containing protein [Tautonia rosea]|uniref:beta-lactamase hydrolase domain-containing protein n=1 Tax=Tautonia rosea TaxID=2728037 RepID=UPI0014729A52|nr:sulfur transferase domain-containing protein [Tautonia rosea]